MMSDCEHIDDWQLKILLLDGEENLDSTQIALHVETCETCQIRLVELVGEDALEVEASQLLSGYAESAREYSTCKSVRNQGEVKSADYYEKVYLDPPSHPEMLGRIGRYEIERCIGSGGMGVVFKAIDTELNRPVAIKVLASHLSRNGAARQRFSRESRAAAAVVHEHVVAIHNVDSSGEHPYLVMQYVSGESLQARIDREGPLSIERILRIGIQAALGLAAAHQQGIVHRDIKPANMMMEDGVDRLLITDFGLARTVDDASLTHTGVVAGTPNYMSPEQAKGDAVDHRTDLFSLGSVLYFVATGHPPFRAERAMGVLNRICHERHRPVWQVNNDIPYGLSDIIDRLLEKRPAKRFSNAAAVAEALTKLLQQVQNRKPHWSNLLRDRVRYRYTLGAFASFSVTAMACAFYWLASIEGKLTWITPDPSRKGPTQQAPDSNMDPASTPQSENQSRIVTETDNQPISPTTRIASDSVNDFDLSGDRTEFNREVSSIDASLNRLQSPSSRSSVDSTAEFQREFMALEKSLQQIDPSRQ